MQDVSATFVFPQFNRVLLSDNVFANFLTKYISSDYLLSAILVMVAMIAIVVAAIYLYLFYKKRTFRKKYVIQQDLENWISSIIMEESAEDIEMPEKFYKLMRDPVARQFAIDELIVCKKNFSGAGSENIVKLYQQLGLKSESVKKMKFGKGWHIRAKGIQELYMMDQQDQLTAIYKQTNSKNEYVRMEAQSGVINLTGYAGLRFLDMISYPVSEWQQLKLLEQLRLSKKKEDLSLKIPAWLLSKNDTVVVFALKLADDFQLFSIKKEVAGCLVHPSLEVRTTALRTMVRLADDETPAQLLGYIKKESLSNQVYILESLEKTATDAEKETLMQLLEHGNDTIKLKTAMVIANCCTGGEALLAAKAANTPEPYQRILLHVQARNKR